MWNIFAEAINDKEEFKNDCKKELRNQVAALSSGDTNNLKGVASFQHMTNLVTAFV